MTSMLVYLQRMWVIDPDDVILTYRIRMKSMKPKLFQNRCVPVKTRPVPPGNDLFLTYVDSNSCKAEFQQGE